MCGLVGIVDLKGVRQEDHNSLIEAARILRDRGPDGVGYAQFPFATIGHARLSIIDIQTGRQPMYSSDRRFCIVYNGEIYNYQELRKSLTGKGYKFKTRSDTEVLLNAYREYGIECLHHLNGMFAFAILDVDRKEVFIARDRLGIKPLYYSSQDGRLTFASELKVFKTLSHGSLEINHQALDYYLARRYVTAPATLLKNVYKLEPGYFAVWKDGILTKRKYWDIPCNDRSQHVDDSVVEELDELLSDAVRLRLIADVPIGIMLSGGLDSTIVTALACDQSKSSIKTFSVCSSGGGEWDETPFARLASRKLGTQHFEMGIPPDVYISSLRNIAWCMDDLVADPASVLLFHVCKLARQEVKVVLSGEGSDELFAGYDYSSMYKPWYRQSIFNKLPLFSMPLIRFLFSKSERIEGYLSRYGLPMAEFIAHFRGVAGGGLLAGSRRDLAHPDISQFYGSSLFQMTWPTYSQSTAEGLIEHCLYGDCKTWLPDNLLTKADRMSMANSLELRVPFLDHRIVEFAARIPLEYKMTKNKSGGYATKNLLRRTFADKIPGEILFRKKQGFTLNWKQLLMRDGFSFVEEVLLSGTLDEYFNRGSMVSLVNELRHQNSRVCQAVLSCLLFALWKERFFG